MDVEIIACLLQKGVGGYCPQPSPTLAYSSNNSLINNVASGHRAGIALHSYSSGNTIINNTVWNNYYGINLWYSSNNVLDSNIADLNYYVGIKVDVFSDGNILMNNTASNNDCGFWIGLSRDNILIGNNVLNKYYGIGVGLSAGTIIYHNNVINNEVQASVDGISQWDDGYPSGGNYWSDYAGVDLYCGLYQNVTGSDGIGDTPYVINENNRDNYPLMSPYEYWSNPIPGDINKDMKVDDKDLLQLAAAYGSTPEKPNWNPHADLNNDNKVDCKDLFTLGTNYGKEWTYP